MTTQWPFMLQRLLFPSCCLLCKRDLQDSADPVCSVCPARWGLMGASMRPAALASVTSFLSLGEFAGGLRDLLHLFKFGGRDYLGSFLMQAWARRHSGFREQVDVVVPIPMAAWREWRRGYNQAEILAQELSRLWDLPLASGALQRQWHSRSQVSLNRSGRLKNAAAGYKLTPKLRLEGKKILLIDDVCTTGATLEACARLLMAAGAAQVSAGVLGVELLKSR